LRISWCATPDFLFVTEDISEYLSVRTPGVEKVFLKMERTAVALSETPSGASRRTNSAMIFE
jgi:hypothetical protein